jgi:hypothetical protein
LCKDPEQEKGEKEEWGICLLDIMQCLAVMNKEQRADVRLEGGGKGYTQLCKLWWEVCILF